MEGYLPQHYPLWAVNATERNPQVRPVVAWTKYDHDRWLPIVAGLAYAAPELRLSVFGRREAAQDYANTWRDRTGVTQP